MDISSILLTAEPNHTCGTFSTSFSDGRRGEAGRFYFESARRSVVEITGSVTIVTYDGLTSVTGRGSSDEAPRRSGDALPSRPPWSFLIPRLAPIFGRAHDDWRIENARPAEDPAMGLARLVSTSGEATGELEMDLVAGHITTMTTPTWRSQIAVGDLTSRTQDSLRRRLDALAPPVGERS